MSSVTLCREMVTRTLSASEATEKGELIVVLGGWVANSIIGSRSSISIATLAAAFTEPPIQVHSSATLVESVLFWLEESWETTLQNSRQYIVKLVLLSPEKFWNALFLKLAKVCKTRPHNQIERREPRDNSLNKILNIGGMLFSPFGLLKESSHILWWSLTRILLWLRLSLLSRA